jgi:hypothetical protein
MKNLIIAITLLSCATTSAYALDWEDTTSTQFGESISTVQALSGYHYRIKANGTLLRKQTGTTRYLILTSVNSVPAAHRTTVSRMFEQYVERSTESSTPGTRSRTRTTTTDSRRFDRHIDRHLDLDMHDASSYRDRDIRFRVHTEGNQAPVIIANDNYHSRVTVNVHPASETMALAIFGENRRLTQQAIASNRSASQAQADLRVERAKPPKVRIVKVTCHKPCACPKTTLCTRNWRCGSHFVDQFNRNWHRTSGPAISNYRCIRSLTGCLGQNSAGFLTFTVTHNGCVIVFTDP